MSEKNRSVSQKSMLLSLSTFASKIASLLAAMIIARMLDKGEYATYKQTFLAFNFVLPFLSLGLKEGLYYFVPLEKKRVRGRVNDCYVIYLLAGIVFSLFIVLGGNKLLASRFHNPEIASLMLWMIPYALIVLMTQCTSVIFNLLDRVKTFMIFNVISTILTSTALIVAMMFFKSAQSAVIVMTLAKVAEGLVSIAMVYFALPKDEWRPQLQPMKEITKFSLPLGVQTALESITKQMDSLFVSVMCMPETYAVYSVGAHELTLVPIICTSVNSAAIPEMRRLIAAGKRRECGELLCKSERRLATILFPAMCFLWVWADEVIAIIYSDKYFDATWIFRVYLLYSLQRIVLSGAIFVALGMGKYLMKRTIAAFVINAILTYIGVKVFGSIGAAIATELSGWIIMLVSIIPTLSKELGIRKRKLYPTLLTVEVVAGSMAIGYAIRYLVCEPFVRGFVEWVGLSSRFGMDVLFDHALYTCVSCVLFLIPFGAFALLLLRKDYEWMLRTAKRFMNKLLRRGKPSEIKPAE